VSVSCPRSPCNSPHSVHVLWTKNRYATPGESERISPITPTNHQNNPQRTIETHKCRSLIFSTSKWSDLWPVLLLTLRSCRNMSCRRPTARGAATSWLVYLSCSDDLVWSSRWLETIIPTNGRAYTAHPAPTGTHATKWPPHAQWARRQDRSSKGVKLR
jgi:hypothetical protein